MSEATKTGLALYGEMHGVDALPPLLEHLDSDVFGVECARWSVDFAFGTVWAREALDRKLRSCVVLGMMIALRQSEETRFHTKVGIANGLTVEEIQEILYTAVPYCGLPAANVAKAAMREGIGELAKARKE